MKIKISILLSILLFSIVGCSDATKTKTPFVWEGANIYFLLTDRFNNVDPSNDINFDRTAETGILRGFEGGDIKGITEKIKDGYFTNLGINAIWFTPVVEQTHGEVDEGTGITYGYHGYWAKDWTALDPNFGTAEDLHELVKIAHANGIRILLDGVINHTGPVTKDDPVWPEEWVRMAPNCNYQNYESTVSCNLVEGLPDIKTESNDDVELPKQLIKKWKSEGRYEKEIEELDAFFERTNYPRAPKYYIIKWLTDYITEFGVDGYRADTVKHVEASVWEDFKKECDYAFAQWKKNNPTKVLDDNDFYLVGEVYNYAISSGQIYNYDGGEVTTNFFKNGFNSLINFEFKYDATKNYETLFSKYSDILNDDLKEYGVLNYVTSHDDGAPFDKQRKKTFESATKLLLSPGTAQVYYGDEFARNLTIEGAIGDATLRSMMDWTYYNTNEKEQLILKHWQKLGKFRRDHPAIGAGIHQMISESPYLFKRTFSKGDYSDIVMVGLGLPKEKKTLDVSKVFENGITLHEAYSNTYAKVIDGKIDIESNYNIVLLEVFNN